MSDYSGINYLLVDENGKTSYDDLKGEDVYCHFDNGIHQPETQDKEGRFTIEGDDNNSHRLKWDCGTRVKFKTQVKDASLEIIGFIVKNFWNNHYLVSEQGSSTPNRYWKVAHSECKQS
jgi:hypothetical protein